MTVRRMRRERFRQPRAQTIFQTNLHDTIDSDELDG
jgi:hypothetical protein